MARNKYPEETRSRIIDVAAELFIEKGYENTSIQNIIDRLGGLSKGAIYHHFRSKEEIMYAVADRIYSGSEREIRRICSREDLSGREKIAEVFRASLESPAQMRMACAAPDMLKNPQLLALFLKDSVQKEAPEVLLPVLEEGIEDGSVSLDARFSRQFAEVIMLISNFWLNPMIYPAGTEELVEKMRFLQYLLETLGLDVIRQDMIDRLVEISEALQENQQGER